MDSELTGRRADTVKARRVRAFSFSACIGESNGFILVSVVNLTERKMLLTCVVFALVSGTAALFAFAYRMDKWHGVLGVVALGLWMFNMQPAHAQARGDENWPAINQLPMEPILVGNNILGDRIILFAQFCGGEGDGSRRDHMHVYAVYNARNTFLQGGCWQYDPAFTKRTKSIKFFSMSGDGWGSWPLDAFHKPRYVK